MVCMHLLWCALYWRCVCGVTGRGREAAWRGMKANKEGGEGRESDTETQAKLFGESRRRRERGRMRRGVVEEVQETTMRSRV